MSNDHHYKIYPRGFLGSDLEPQTERTKNELVEKTKKLHYTAFEAKHAAGIEGNPHVEALYATLIKNDIKISSPVFRTTALKVALTAFGTRNFFEWFSVQYKSPACGSIHNDFLIDTLRYIKTGIRNLSLETWGALVLITDEGNSIGKPGIYSEEFFNNHNGHVESSRLTNVDLLDVIQMWCEKSNGLEDMIGTLHILFGGLK